MKAKRKKSMADISAQVDRLLKNNHSVSRERIILHASNEYRYSILAHFRCSFGFTDRAYYTKVTRKSYAGY